MKYLIPSEKIDVLKDNIVIKLKHEFQFPINTAYLMSTNNLGFRLAFFTKFDYARFFSNLNAALRKNLVIFFVKFKLKGLGYRFKKMSSYLYRFYFTRTSYIYLHRPKNVIIKHRKKRIIMLSSDKQRLNNVFNSILYLHKVGPYNRRGFLYPRNIIFKKPGKKIV